MNFLLLEELEKLNTKRLLAYKRKLYKRCMFEPEDYVWDCINNDCDCSDQRKRLEDLRNHIELVKSVLKDREHVERKRNV